MVDWVNSDGLGVNFGINQAAAVNAGELEVDGDLFQIAIPIADATAIPATASSVTITETITVPDNARVESVSLYVTTAFTSGGAATLDIGLFNDDGDGTFSVNDANGLVAGSAVAALVNDAKVSGAGAQVGTRVQGTGNRGLAVSYGYGTAAFTAGAADIIIRYRL